MASFETESSPSSPTVRHAESNSAAGPLKLARELGFQLGLFAALLTSAFVAMRLISLPPTNVTVIWLPAGIAVLALRQRWSKATIATIFLTHWAIIALANDYALWSFRPWSLTMAAANTAGPAIAAACWRRWVSDNAFSDPAGFLRFIVIVAVLPSLATTWVIPTVIWAAGYLPDLTLGAYLTRVGSITLSSILGVFLLVPIFCAPWRERPAFSRPALVSVQLANLGVALAIGFIGFQLTAVGLYLAIPYALIAVIVVGPRGLAIGLLGFVCYGLWATAHGSGPFAGPDQNPIASLFEMAAAALGVGLPAYYAGLAVRELQTRRSELQKTVSARTRQLDESNERYRLATDAVSEGIFDWHNGIARSFYNATIRRRLGNAISEDRMSWISVWRMVHPNDRKSLAPAVKDVVYGTAETFSFDGRLETPEHGWVWVRARGRVIERDRDGRANRIVGTFNDIDIDKKQLQDLDTARELADSRERAKTTFLANMSHEIRTPMHAMLGFAQLLDSTELNPKQRECVDAILNSGGLLLTLLNDLLDLSRIEAGAVELAPSAVDLSDALSESVGLFESQASQKGIRLELNLPRSMPPPLLIDRLRLHQVISNLISNAVKFTGEGRVTVTASATRIDTGQDTDAWRIKVAVADTGIGISPEQIKRLFNPFVQADSTITLRFGGTGLGLAISQRLCELMGGNINVTSQAGRGSKFTASFIASEIARDASDDDSDKTDSRHMPTKANQSLDVLVVEDNALNRKLAGMMLQRLGHHAIFAENGRHAMEKLAGQSFDIVLMDLRMPELDGFETTKAIRAKEAESGQSIALPIIALTANAEEEEKQNCMEAGMNDFLTKPLDLRTLEATLKRVRSDRSRAPGD